MIGPVFGAEVKRAGRRGRAHVLRWVYAGWLVVELLVLFFNYLPSPTATGPAPAPTAGETAAFARGFVELVLFQQFALVFLATPAFAAGAVTDEKTRGTLQQLLTADLRAYDIVVAMYHDQGHIPMKLLAFDSGVNVSVGLPIIRTSVDHGTAFDIAGTGKASEESMLAAIDVAVQMVRAKRPGSAR